MQYLFLLLLITVRKFTRLNAAPVICLVSIPLVTIFTACGQHPHHEPRLSKGDSSTLRFYERKSSAYQTTSPDSAIYFTNQGLKLARRLHDRGDEARMLDRLARINEQYGNVKLAIRYEKAALHLFHTLKTIPDSTDAMASLGILLAKHGNFAQGERLIGQSLNLYRQSKNTKGLISAYTRLGELNELSGHTDKALPYYLKAEQLNQGRPLSDEYFSLLGSIGKLHTRLGNDDSAAAYFEKGVNKSQADRYTRAHIALLNHAGKAYAQQGNKQQALAYHQQALEKAQANGLHEEEARSLMGIAGVVKEQDAAQSIRHMKNALGIARSIGQQQLTAEIYRSLSDLYRQQSRYTEALTALDEHHRLLDSLKNAATGHKIATLQSSYELTEAKIRVESLEIESQRRTSQRNLVILAALATLIVLLVLTVYFYKTRRLNKSLAASNRVKDTLFSVIGHDLKGPAGSAAQLFEMMETEDFTPEEMKSMIGELRKQTGASLELLKSLFEWGRSQLQGIRVNPSDFLVQRVVERSVHLLSQQVAQKHLQITIDLPDALRIRADADHFEFVIRNLLSNAIKFSYEGGTIAVSAQKPDRHSVVFAVKDMGTGISKDQQKLFLTSNLQVNYGTRKEQGSGLGLLLTKDFVKANHGRIWLESEEGQGTTFYVAMPAA